VVLPDNGPEFSDPETIEKYRPDPVHNSTKLVPRGIKVFFCDPYCSSQGNEGSELIDTVKLIQ
nr:hypothetical protein [Kiritimatiellia bacterium]